ncbi:conserved protein of unknown function [uncultured Woeseiaceae bacterium]|uniref:DUF350 domain-containing protein n=1 Tax=uncultured Woeseiaceae bacterium TaxID=1983305 RepID=A0A7D9D298_9GAMM|nr:conserved protein of unknown function [uncultured Woeseiaceae bacterium]
MEIEIVVANFSYAVLGALVTIVLMMLGYKVLDWLTPFDTSTQLGKNNVAVGIVVGAMFVGLGIAVGLVVGLGLN